MQRTDQLYDVARNTLCSTATTEIATNEPLCTSGTIQLSAFAQCIAEVFLAFHDATVLRTRRRLDLLHGATATVLLLIALTALAPNHDLRLAEMGIAVALVHMAARRTFVSAPERLIANLFASKLDAGPAVTFSSAHVHPTVEHFAAHFAAESLAHIARHSGHHHSVRLARPTAQTHTRRTRARMAALCSASVSALELSVARRSARGNVHSAAQKGLRHAHSAAATRKAVRIENIARIARAVMAQRVAAMASAPQQFIAHFEALMPFEVLRGAPRTANRIALVFAARFQPFALFRAANLRLGLLRAKLPHPRVVFVAFQALRGGAAAAFLCDLRRARRARRLAPPFLFAKVNAAAQTTTALFATPRNCVLFVGTLFLVHRQ